MLSRLSTLLVLFLAGMPAFAAQEPEYVLTDALRQKAAQLIKEAEKELGAGRENETPEQVDARNRAALGKLWDAQWILRGNEDLDVDVRVADAATFFAPPLLPAAPFACSEAIATILLRQEGDTSSLVTGTNTGSVLLWDVSTGKVARQWKGMGSEVRFLAVSDKYVLCVSLLGEFAVLDRPLLKKLVQTYPKAPQPEGADMPQYAHSALVLEEDGKTEVRIVYNNFLLLYDVTNTKELARYAMPLKEVTGASLSANGKTMALCSQDQILRVFKVEDQIKPWREVNYWPEDVPFERFDSIEPKMCISPDGRYAVIAQKNNHVLAYDIEGEKKIDLGVAIRGKTTDLTFLSEKILMVRDSQALHFLDVVANKEVALMPLESGLTAVLPRQDASFLCYLANGTQITKLVSGEKVSRPTRPAPVLSLHFFGDQLLIGGGYGEIGRALGLWGEGTAVVDLPHQKVLQTYPGFFLAFDAEQKRLATHEKNASQIIDLTNSKTIVRETFAPEEMVGHYSYAHPAAAFAPNGKFAVMSACPGGITAWKLPDGTCLGKIGPKGYADMSDKVDGNPMTLLPAKNLTISPSGQFLIMSTIVMNEGTTMQLNLQENKVKKITDFYNDSLHAYHFSADEKYLASASCGSPVLDTASNNIKRLNRGLGEIVGERGSENIVAVCFSPDGKWLATVDRASRKPWGLGKRDTLIRVFEVGTWKLRDRFDAGPHATALLWLPDSKSAYLGHADGSISKLLLVRKVP